MLKIVAVFGEWLWVKTPDFVKYALMIIIIPNLAVSTAIFFMVLVPWHRDTTHAMILSFKERRDTEIAAMVKEQNLKYEHISQSLDRQEAHLKNIYSELIKR